MPDQNDNEKIQKRLEEIAAEFEISEDTFHFTHQDGDVNHIQKASFNFRNYVQLYEQSELMKFFARTAALMGLPGASPVVIRNPNFFNGKNKS